MKRKFINKFAPRELTGEENKKYLEKKNVPVNEGRVVNKFGAFGGMGKDILRQKRTERESLGIEEPQMSAEGLYTRQQGAIYGTQPSRANDPNADSSNPYATAAPVRGNPYAQDSNNLPQHPVPAPPPDTYARTSSLAGEPLKKVETSQSTVDARQRLFGSSDAASISSNNPYSFAPSEPAYDELAELNSSGASIRSSRPYGYDTGSRLPAVDEVNVTPNELDELNAVPGESKNDYSPDDELLQMPSEVAPPGASASGEVQAVSFDDDVNSDDEEAEELKLQIRDEKKRTVQSTRNALRVAAEAENSGRNTLGMLGYQGDTLANTEKNIGLGANQSRIAEDKANELKKLNRSIFLPNVSNPFNSRRRLQEKEARLKQERIEEQNARERRSKAAQESEQRVMAGLNETGGVGYSETAARVRRQMMRGSDERKQYQFEADSEDEELEDEIDMNLDSLSHATNRLHNLSLSMNDEVKAQNTRLDGLITDTDKLDVDVHMNSVRMAAFK